MPKHLPVIGPTIPEVRDFMTDVGVVVVNYARLERLMIETIDVVVHLESGGIVQVPEEFKAVRARKGKRTLGRLVEELKALGANEETAQQLGQVNSDRIEVVHKAARLIDDAFQLDFDGIHSERVRIRKFHAREKAVFRLMQEAQYEIFSGFLAVAERSLKGGVNDPRLADIQDQQRRLKAILDREKPKP
jgi:hypothetical protein